VPCVFMCKKMMQRRRARVDSWIVTNPPKAPRSLVRWTFHLRPLPDNLINRELSAGSPQETAGEAQTCMLVQD